MEIRNSKSKNLSYAAIGFLIILLIFYKSYPDFDTDKTLVKLNIFCALFFGSINIYFIVLAFSKKPLYIIDDKKIVVCRGNKTYLLKDLSFFSKKEFGGRYGRYQKILFYNKNKEEVFSIVLAQTDKSLDQIIKRIKSKLQELK